MVPLLHWLEIQMDELRVQLAKMEYQVVLDCALVLNGLGEVVTVHVQSCGLRCSEDAPDRVMDELRDNGELLVLTALAQALKNSKDQRESRDDRPVEAPVQPDDGREDHASDLGGTAHAGARTEPDGGSA